MDNTYMWRKYGVALLVALVLGGTFFLHGSASVAALTTTSLTHLENSSAQWGLYQDGGQVQGTITNVAQPSLDGNALAASLTSGQPYTGMHVYRNLAAADSAVTFQLDLSFQFSNAAAVQALEFTTSKWYNNKRWELAMQWENVGDGGAQQGAAHSWRLWTGGSWQNTGVVQSLNAQTWHTFHLTGKIVNGNIQYTGFRCDAQTISLSQTFAPVASAGDLLAVAVQLDGNGNEDAYQMYVDGVTLKYGDV